VGFKLKVLIGELREASGIHEQTDFEPINDNEQQMVDQCICSSCPSYARGAPTTEPQEKGYCGHGESNLEVKKNGCLCPSCEIYKKNKWIGWYFCITGRAEAASSPGATGVQEPETPGGEAGEGPTGDEEGGEEPTIPGGPPETQQKGTKQAMGGMGS
jgi:hypothetical protein